MFWRYTIEISQLHKSIVRVGLGVKECKLREFGVV